MAGTMLALPAFLSCSCRPRESGVSPESPESLREQENLAKSPNEQIGVGIIGCGRIGGAVGRRGKGFGMDVIYHNRKPNPGCDKDGFSFVPFDMLIKEADIISLHVPLSDDTHYLIDSDVLSRMKKDALLINTSRGPVIDEKALSKALLSKEIGGAALDVFEREPQIEETLLSLKNVVLAPHIGSATEVTRNRMAVMAAENIIAALNGTSPPNLVNS